MSYWELEPELWELLPDDSYDGARNMERRGRIHILQRSLELPNAERG